jgi:iron(III) transport system ATP-binding protein
VFDNIAFGLAARPRARRPTPGQIRARVETLLELVQIAFLADRYPGQLSGGQRQRVALARALAVEPRVLLLDEPFGALDATVRRGLRRWLRRLHADLAVTTVFVTHDQEEALALSDRIALMNKGRIEQIGEPESIYTAPATAFVADFIGAANLIEAEVVGPGPLPRQAVLRLEGRELVVYAEGPVAAGKALLAARPEDLRLAAPGAATPNALPGTIERRRYLGFKVSYRVRLPGGRVIAVDLHGPAKEPYAEGQSVIVVFDPRASILVTR